jgi:hypothetical protein
MAQTIKLKRGTTTPTTSNLVSGEVAIDTSAQKLYINDGGTVKEIGGGGGGITYSLKTSAYTASAGDGIIADSSGGAFTITLPASPSTGDIVSIVDGAAWATNNVTVARNGSTIEGASEDLVLDVSSLGLDLVYDGSTWQLYPRSSAQLATTVGIDDNATTTAITIDASENVGIGHSSPVAKLAVLGSSNDTVAEANANLCVEGGGGNGIIFGTQASSPYRSYIQSGFVSNLSLATYDLMLNPEGGKVGIGKSPVAQLDVANGTTYVSSGDFIARIQQNTNATGKSGLSVMNAWASATSSIFEAAMGWNGTAEGYYPVHTIDGLGQQEIKIFDSGTHYTVVNIVATSSGGEVRIRGNTDRGAYNLQVNGSGVWGQGSYINGSDARWKDNVQTLECNCLDIINNLRSVSFTYNEASGASDLTTPHLGFIAQEVEQATGNHPWLSGLVTEDPEGYKSMAYQGLIPILTKAIQEQQALIEVLQADVEQLKGAN